MGSASRFVIGGQRVPSALLAQLRDTHGDRAEAAECRQRLTEDGYLLLRGFLPAQDVAAARRVVLQPLADVGEIRAPAIDGILTGRSDRAARQPDAGAFWRDLSEAPALRRVTHGPRLRKLMADLLSEPAAPFDFVWLRTTAPGRTSPFHFDHVYMNRGSQRVLSCWIPLGNVPAEDGPIAILEGSHRLETMIADFRGHDVDRDPSRPGYVEESPLALAERYGRRLLSAEFAAGDILVFGMFLLHGSCDNVSPQRRVRLSCDVRYQPAADARDPRWFGAPPLGHGGKSYAGLSSARPITQPPIAR